MHDQELIEGFLGGRVDYFDQLVLRYQDRVFNLAWQLLADQRSALFIAQQVFVRLYLFPKEFKAAPDLLFKLFSSVIKLSRQQQKVLPRVLDAFLVENPVQIALDQLTQDLREIVILRDLEGLSFDAVSSILGFPASKVKANLIEAHKQLNTILADKL